MVSDSSHSFGFLVSDSFPNRERGGRGQSFGNQMGPFGFHIVFVFRVAFVCELGWEGLQQMSFYFRGCGSYSLQVWLNRLINGMDRLMLVVSCGTNVIVGQLWHNSDCWYSAARILLASQPAGQQTSQPVSQPAARQPASKPASQSASQFFWDRRCAELLSNSAPSI